MANTIFPPNSGGGGSGPSENISMSNVNGLNAALNDRVLVKDYTEEDKNKLRALIPAFKGFFANANDRNTELEDILEGLTENIFVIQEDTNSTWYYKISTKAWINTSSGSGGGGGDLEDYYTKEEIDVLLEDIEGGTYTGTAGITVGGINAGDTFEDVPLPTMINNIINPELSPALTNPNNTLTSLISGLREIGTTISPVLSATFNRGSINPQYQSEEAFRAGLPTKYNFTSSKGLNQDVVSTSLSAGYTVSSFAVEIGTVTFNGNVSYSAGVQPKTNKGNNFSTPLDAGTTGNKSITITGVYPCYSGITLSKLPLAAHGGNITVDAPTDMDVNGERFKIQYPTVWSAKAPIVQQENELSKTWDNQSMSDYEITDITVNGTAYKQVKYISSGIGARKLRLVF